MGDTDGKVCGQVWLEGKLLHNCTVCITLYKISTGNVQCQHIIVWKPGWKYSLQSRLTSVDVQKRARIVPMSAV